MPRTYSFDHYTVPKSGEPVPERGHKRQRGGKRGGGGGGELHYGKQHAETEDLYNARRMESQLEELAGLDGEERPRMSRAEADDRDVVEQLRKQKPIGAIPTAELPGRRLLRDVWGDGLRQLRLLRDGSRDVLQAARNLFRLPSDALRVLLRRPREA